MIVIAGYPEKQHTAYVYQKICERGGQAVFFDIRQYPNETLLTWSAQSPAKGFLKPTGKIPAILVEDIHAVYWRYRQNYVDISHIPHHNPANQQIIYLEIRSSIGSFFRSLPCLQIEEVNRSRFQEQQLLSIWRPTSVRFVGLP